MTATINDLWEAFQRCQKAILGLHPKWYYRLVLGSDGSGELRDHENVKIAHWDFMAHGVVELNRWADTYERVLQREHPE